MKNPAPKIVFLLNRSRSFNNTFQISCSDFINFIETENIKTVFSTYDLVKKIKTHLIFTIKDGFVNSENIDEEIINAKSQSEKYCIEDFYIQNIDISEVSKISKLL